jgi:hypothetical protein
MDWVSAEIRQFPDVECVVYEGQEANEKPTLLAAMDRKQVGYLIAAESDFVAER